jgi:lysosomal acid lipase/cholesteryl ester hydrolase
MLNARGSTYSKNHQTLDSCGSCHEFWDFGLEESAVHDYAITVDFILEETGAKDIFFVGYSMGTTQYLILLSQLPEYNDKIKAGFLLGPTAFGGNTTAFIGSLSEQSNKVKLAMDFIGVHEFLPNYPEVKSWLAHTICTSSLFYSDLCLNFLALFLGMNPDSMHRELVKKTISIV